MKASSRASGRFARESRDLALSLRPPLRLCVSALLFVPFVVRLLRLFSTAHPLPLPLHSSIMRTLRFLAAVLLLASLSFAAAPAVTKLEPPNWWAGLHPSPMLLLTGDNLAQAHVSTSYPGVRIARTEPGLDGRYLFVFLSLAPNVKPGNVSLAVKTSDGAATITLPLLRRQPAAGRYQGLSLNDVVYLIMPDRFSDGDPSNDQPPGSTGTDDRSNSHAWHGGDLQGIINHLPYLHDLGVTALWLTPVWKNSSNDYHGYGVVDFYAIDPHMGTLADYQRLVAAAHKLGIKIVLDYVVNHTGPQHPWAAAPPTATWFHGSPQHHLDPLYQFDGEVDPHAPPKFSRGTIEGWFAGVLPDLNPGDPLVSTYLLDNAIWWTEGSGLDALRLDTFPYSPRSFWSKWLPEINRTYPRLTSVGEVWDFRPTITAFFDGGQKRYDGIDTGVSTVFDFPTFHAIRDVTLQGKPLTELIQVLENDWLYAHPERLVTFIGNHDTRRFMGEQGATPGKLKNALGLLLTLRGIPEIYTGDEIGMPGGEDPDNRRDFPGGFPGDPRDAFTASGRTPEQQEIFSYVQSLLALRRAHPALRDGRLWHIGYDDTYYAFLREDAGERLLVVFDNAAARQVSVTLGDTPLAGAHAFTLLFGNGTAQPTASGVDLGLSPGLAIYEVK